MLEILLFSDHRVQTFDVRKEMIRWKSCVRWEHRLFGRKNRKKGSSEHSHWYVCRCSGGLMTGLDLVPKTQVWSLMECRLHREPCCRENMFLSVHSLFIVLGKETMSWPHQATALQGSHRFVVCEWGRGGQYSYLLMESVQSNLRTPRVFYREDGLSRNPVSGVSDRSCFREVRNVPPDQAPGKGGSCFSSAGN